jgi:hypothetical protein
MARSTGWKRRSRGLGIAAVSLAALSFSGCAVGLTDPATNVATTTATLNGQIFSDEDADIEYWFSYGKTKAYGTETPHQTITIDDRDAHPVSQAVSGLSSGTLYRYQLCVDAPDAAALCLGDRTFTTAGSISTLSVEANPKLFPAFNPAVPDYVTRCKSSPVEVVVSAPGGTTVAVNGQPGQSGNFTQTVSLTPGRDFDFTTTTAGQTRTYHVRCLPSNFPGWTYSRLGTPGFPFYITTPQAATTPEGAPAARYVAIFDDRGVPVWWNQASATDAKLLPDGNLVWYTPTSGGTSTPGYEVRRLDGSLVRTWRTVGAETDLHDFQLLPNGNALMLAYPDRPGTVDLSPFGLPSENATVADGEIQEVTPGGSLVWSWNTKDHIPLRETGRWWPMVPVNNLPDGRVTYDYAHINSAQQVGNSIILSFRHFDAHYGIARSTGDILWKIGGTPRFESLTPIEDPHAGNPLGGPHYGRFMPDGSITIHDNRSFLGERPRAAHYRLNLFARTAELIDEKEDPLVGESFCCGSAEKFTDGTWLMSWGGNQEVTEFGPNHARRFVLTFDTGLSYRVAPIRGASPTIADLRAGMDAQAD